MNHRERIIVLGMLILGACTSKKNETEIDSPVLINYSVHSSMPHDTKAFTEGLTIYKGQLYESTGDVDSWVGIVNIKTGIADKKVELDDKYFGEGITILNKKIYQLTWKDHTGFVYDLSTFKELRQFSYNTEGWGLTHNGTNLIMSDGTDQLYLLDTANFSVTRTIAVKYKNDPVQSLNELEYVNGFVYANIWQTNMIAKIDTATGEVAGFLDLTPLARQARLNHNQIDVLNGVAWHETTKSLLVTGKHWPFIYVLKLRDTPVNP